MYNMSALKEKNAYHYVWHLDKLLYFQELLQERENGGRKGEVQREMEIKGEKKNWGWREEGRN